MIEMGLSERDIKKVKSTIKGNLESDFIENYGVWKRSLDDVNNIIKVEIEKCLFIRPFYDELLYTYDELCNESLLIVESMPFEDGLDAANLSSEITKRITYNKLYDIIETYLYFELH